MSHYITTIVQGYKQSYLSNYKTHQKKVKVTKFIKIINKTENQNKIKLVSIKKYQGHFYNWYPETRHQHASLNHRES